MSRSVSAPSSVTNTSPCWNGLIVPGSTLRYGSNFCAKTSRPRAFSRRPSEAATMPFPSADTTPPVTKTYLVLIWERPRAVRVRWTSAREGRRERSERSSVRDRGRTLTAPSAAGRPALCFETSTKERSCDSAPGADLTQYRRPLDQLAEAAALTDEVQARKGADRGPAAFSRESKIGSVV